VAGRTTTCYESPERRPRRVAVRTETGALGGNWTGCRASQTPPGTTYTGGVPATSDPSSHASPVSLTSGLPDTVLPPEPEDATARLERALEEPPQRRRDAVADVVRSFPRSLSGWSTLGSLAGDDIEAYAYYRVGYHRGLDALRAAGWRGSGTVRWSETSNQGFLRCVDGLRAMAGAIGEQEEEERCDIFLRQLDPTWRPGRTGIHG
jgi:hypothetical protein